MASCAICSAKLPGVSSEGKGKTSKRPERPFAGVLCSSCLRESQRTKAKLNSGMITEEQVPVKYRKYL